MFLLYQRDCQRDCRRDYYCDLLFPLPTLPTRSVLGFPPATTDGTPVSRAGPLHPLSKKPLPSLVWRVGARRVPAGSRLGARGVSGIDWERALVDIVYCALRPRYLVGGESIRCAYICGEDFACFRTLSFLGWDFGGNNEAGCLEHAGEFSCRSVISCRSVVFGRSVISCRSVISGRCGCSPTGPPNPGYLDGPMGGCIHWCFLA